MTSSVLRRQIGPVEARGSFLLGSNVAFIYIDERSYERRPTASPTVGTTSPGRGPGPRPGRAPARNGGAAVRSVRQSGVLVSAGARPRAGALPERQPRRRPNTPDHHRPGGVSDRSAVCTELLAAVAVARGHLDRQPHTAAAPPPPGAGGDSGAKEASSTSTSAPIAGRQGGPVPPASAVTGRSMARRAGGTPPPGSLGPVCLAGGVVA